MTTVLFGKGIMADPSARRSATHQRILDAAGRLFRQQGVDGVGVDAVMKEAGLTHGGFYAHFPSKDALAAEVARALLEKSAAKWDEISQGPDRDAALARIVSAYLDMERVRAGQCCALTTLGPDVGRRGESRAAIRQALDQMIGALTRLMPGRRRQRALAALSTLVGAVVLARLADDPDLAKAFLDAAACSVRPVKQTASPLQ